MRNRTFPLSFLACRPILLLLTIFLLVVGCAGGSRIFSADPQQPVYTQMSEDWQVLAVDDWSMPLSFAFDRQGDPAVAYLKPDDSILRLARLKDDEWQIEEVEAYTQDAGGWHLDLLFDADGLPLISEVQRIDSDLALVTLESVGENWSKTVVAEDVNPGHTCVVDAAGNLAIAFTQEDDELWLARRNGGAWQLSLLALDVRTSNAVPGVGFDSGSELGISFQNTERNLVFAREQDLKFSGDRLTRAGMILNLTSVDFDSGGNPAVLFVHSESPGVSFAQAHGDGWTVHPLSFHWDDIRVAKGLRFDEMDRPWFALYTRTEGADGTVYMVHRDGGEWYFEPLFTGAMPRENAFCLDMSEDGCVGVAWSAQNNDVEELRVYLRQTG